eukprot:CAMPEP_0170358512 /NCGR_PEP_ID=MMETSP0117_2-20130122/2267_1 /TAXON_ID=400756 /ORGANISM="Durinskia baltica, Strain CSIRO CS-38" /LENGTH=387 /DNA_ID=CAMNT_0010612725 /DNA_START=110 /DNA_END=1273 /DNA_ORIENTATION=+
MSMVDNMGSIGIGNYKGVMLCNRPFGGTAANKMTSGASGEKTTFTCGLVSEAAGLNVPISAKEKLIKRPNKDSVLAKHKKWLSDLQKTKDRLEMEFLEEARRKEEAQAKFQEHEKKMRLAARTTLHSAEDKSSDSKYTGESKNEEKNGPATVSFASDEVKAQSKSDGDSAAADAKTASSASAAGAKQQRGGQFKPAWAMTEQAAEVHNEEAEHGEEDALLDFARSLDFDRYMGDVEVQAVMEKLRKRITDLEREVSIEDMRNADAETRAALRAKLDRMGLTEASLLLEANGTQSEESEALAAARALLQEEDDMQAVHSAKSVAALLKTAKDKIAQVKAAVQPPPPSNGEPRVTNEPLIVVHDPNEGSRLEVKNALSKLPYMNRNPAV